MGNTKGKITFFLWNKNKKSHFSWGICENVLQIDEYAQKTPFDGLEEGQEALFIKLQKTLGDNYEAVEGKITPIVNELRSKNTLVDKYLNNSENSYKLSKVALYATIFFGIFGVLGLIESIRARKERRASK